MKEASEASEETNDLGVINNYKLLKEIGSGTQSVVYKAVHLKKNLFYAVKALVGQSLSRNKRLVGAAGYRVKNEIAVLKLIDHPNLVKLVEVIDDEENDILYLVMKLVAGEPLVIAKHEEKVSQNYFKQILSGVGYLHKTKIIHRDIKPSNILLEATTGNVLICDFGISCFSSQSKVERMLGTDDLITSEAGTLAFLPPEAHQGLLEPYNGRPADIWSLGVTLYAIVYGKMPFTGSTKEKLINRICNNQVSFPQGAVSEQCKSIIRLMLEKNPNKRPTAQILLSHPWISAEFKDDVTHLKNYKSFDTLARDLDSNLVEKAVSSIKTTFWSFVVTEKIKQLKILTEIESKIENDLVPSLSTSKQQVENLAKTLGVTFSSPVENATELLRPSISHVEKLKSSHGVVSRLKVIRETDFMKHLKIHFLQLETLGQDEKELDLCQSLLKIINSDFLNIFSLSSTNTVQDMYNYRPVNTSLRLPLVFFEKDGFSNYMIQRDITEAQKLELMGENLQAAEKFFLTRTKALITFTAKGAGERHSSAKGQGGRKSKIRGLVRRRTSDAMSKLSSTSDNEVFPVITSENVPVPNHKQVLNVVVIGLGYACASFISHLEKLLSKWSSQVYEVEISVFETRTHFVHKISGLRASVLGTDFCHRTLVPNENILKAVGGNVYHNKVLEIDVENNQIWYEVSAKGSSMDLLSRKKACHFDFLVCGTGAVNTSVGEPPLNLTRDAEMQEWYQEVSTVIQRARNILILLKMLQTSSINFHSSCPLSKKDICGFKKGYKVSNSSPFKIEFSNETAKFDLILTCTGRVLANTIYPVSWLNAGGEVKVNEYLQVGRPNIFVIGDVNNWPETKDAFNASRQGAVAAENVLMSIKNFKYRMKRPLKRYGTKKHITLLSFGERISLNLSVILGPIGYGRTVYFDRKVSTKGKSKQLMVSENWKLFNQEDKLRKEIRWNKFELTTKKLDVLQVEVEEQDKKIELLEKALQHKEQEEFDNLELEDIEEKITALLLLYREKATGKKYVPSALNERHHSNENSTTISDEDDLPRSPKESGRVSTMS
eukprot:augustus_masked-scaffold_41-processed-gene-2.16-mRNA-1 protein AED:0.37 eAED:0.37 QI:0/0/0/0.5/1/1/2/0/1058